MMHFQEHNSRRAKSSMHLSMAHIRLNNTITTKPGEVGHYSEALLVKPSLARMETVVEAQSSLLRFPLRNPNNETSFAV